MSLDVNVIGPSLEFVFTHRFSKNWKKLSTSLDELLEAQHQAWEHHQRRGGNHHQVTTSSGKLVIILTLIAARAFCLYPVDWLSDNFGIPYGYFNLE